MKLVAFATYTSKDGKRVSTISRDMEFATVKFIVNRYENKVIVATESFERADVAQWYAESWTENEPF